MLEAYKQNSQFIFLLIVMYVIGVWVNPIIYLLFPIIFGLFGYKLYVMELIITSLWLLMLSDYRPVENATHDDLKFAKDLKFLIPLMLFFFILLHKDYFAPYYSKLIYYFIPFFVFAAYSLTNSYNVGNGIQKNLSYILMFLSIPILVKTVHHKMGALFWKSLFTFIIGMLSIGIVLKFAAPEIGTISGGRFKGVLGNPNGIGIFVYLTFVLYMVLQEFKLVEFSRKEKYFILIVIFLSLIWCGSRNALMSIFLFYIAYRLVQIHWTFAIIAVIIVIGFDDLFFEIFMFFVEFFSLEEFFRIDTLEKGSGRIIAWNFAWIEIQKNYLIVGGGFGQDEKFMGRNYQFLSMQGHQGGIHNTYLSFWFNTGILGLISYFIGYFLLLFKAIKNNKIALAFLISLLFNLNYESWLMASLNPFTIVMLFIVTILFENLSGNDYKT